MNSPYSTYGETARKGLHRVADDAGRALESARDRVLPGARRLASEAEGLAHRGYDTLREGSLQLRDRAAYAGERSMRYVRDEPVKSVVIAAVAAGALMALAHWLSRRSDR